MLQLAAAMKQPEGLQVQDGEELIEVSLPARGAGKLYERARTAVEYQEEHLLRRNAIRRILRRYVGTGTTIADIANNVLTELIWAHHLPNNEVPVRMKRELIPVLEKYEPLLEEIDSFMEDERDDAMNWVLDVLSTEVEYLLTPPYRSEALVSYMYEEMRNRIDWDSHIKLSDEQKDLLTYICVHKVLLKSNDATLRFRVLTLYYPDWPGASTPERIREVQHHLQDVIKTVDSQIHHPVIEKMSVQMRRKAGVFLTVRDAFEINPDEVPALLNDPAMMDRHIARTLKKRTKEFRNRLRRTVVRSILFILITKSIFALLIEVPYELFFLEERHYEPVIINIFLPPALLALIAFTLTIPERKNTADYQEAVRALMTGVDHDLLAVRMKRESFSSWNVVFNAMYAITYLIIYGGMAALLSQFNFTWVSILLFLFFVSVTVFFGIRVRGAVRDIVLSQKRRGLFGTIFDFFMVPVVRAGRWLNNSISKINVFMYFFDFILEAPIKIAIRFFDSWTNYIREKREEI